MDFNSIINSIKGLFAKQPLVSPVAPAMASEPAKREQWRIDDNGNEVPRDSYKGTTLPDNQGQYVVPEKPAYDPNFKFNVSPYMVNNDRWKARFGNTDPNQYIESKVTPEQQQMIRQYFPTDATRAAVLRLTEDRLVDNPDSYDGNSNGTVDSGAYMNNSGTFADMMKRPVMAKRIANRGINSFDDLKSNVELATRMAKLTADPNLTGNFRFGGYAPPVPDYMGSDGKMKSGFLGVNKPGPWFAPNDAGFDLSKQLY